MILNFMYRVIRNDGDQNMKKILIHPPESICINPVDNPMHGLDNDRIVNGSIKSFEVLRNKMCEESRLRSISKTNIKLLKVALRKLRKQKGITQDMLAAQLKTKQPVIARFEGNISESFNLNTLIEYAACIGCYITFNIGFISPAHENRKAK